MTREEQVEFCKNCLNRKMDIKQGVLCNLTGEKAAFQIECSDYKRDESIIVAPLNDTDALQTSEIKRQLSFEVVEKLRMEQKLIPGILSSLIVGVLGAILWGTITVSTEFQIGYMAVAIGAAVGITLRKFGNGIDKVFGIWGAAISLFSVLLGNFLSIIGFLANSVEFGYLETLIRFDYTFLPEIMSETFSVMDVFFYGIAVYEGYRFSFRVVTEKDISDLKEMNTQRRV